MKFKTKWLIGGFACSFIIYLVFSFGCVTFDFREWTLNARSGAAVLFALANLVGAIGFIVNFNELE